MYPIQKTRVKITIYVKSKSKCNVFEQLKKNRVESETLQKLRL